MDADSVSPPPHDGRCTCGQVRFRVHGRPLFVHACHCFWCQRETGSAFVLNALIEHDRVELLAGSPAEIRTPSESGKGQLVSRCPACQVALWSTYAGAGPAFRFVRVGTLDRPDRMPPDIHIYTASKQPWMILPPDTPATPEYYDRATYWPADSLARRRAHIEKNPRR